MSTQATAAVGVLFVVLANVATLAVTEPIRITPLARDGHLLVSFELTNGLTEDVRDAIRSGLATTIIYDVELRRGSSIWFDETIASVKVTPSVRFDNLTRRYQLSLGVDGRVESSRMTEDEQAVRQWMTNVQRLPLSRTAALEANAEYYVRVRARTRPRNTWFFWPWDHSAAWGHAKFTFLP